MNMMGGYPQPNANVGGAKFGLPTNPQLKGLFFGFIAAVAVMVIGCFLPYMTASAFGYSESVNYISNNGEMADGVFLIILGVVAIVLLLARKYLVSTILQIVSGVILAIDFFNDMDMTNSYVKFGYGFYITLVAVIASIVLGILLWKKAKSSIPAGQPMMQPGMPQRPMGAPQGSNQSTCPYCGSPKTPGSFCPNCGAK